MKTFKLNTFLLVLSLFLLNIASLHAQTTTVRGRITDSKDKQPIIGASVQEIDNDKRVITATQTNIDGNFALRATNPKNQIQVSYIGYKTQTIGINNRTEINVALVASANELAIVAVQGKRNVNTGGTFNISDRDNAVATSSISQKDLAELSAQSIDQALQGRLPGVDIGTTSGDPGAGMSIRIRGTASLNGSAEPLIVLDGLPYETEIPDDFNFGSADEQGYAQLLNIAPTDINEITVLKDAAATAIWGSRGANGVLVITTKRGTIGKPQVNYAFQGFMQKQPEAIPLLNGDQFSSLIPEEFANAGGLPLNQLQNPEFNYDPLVPATFYNFSNNTDWIKEITKIAYSQSHNINLSGGGEKALYRASFGYAKNNGTTVGTDLNKINVKVNLDYNVSNRITFKTDFTYAHLVTRFNYASVRSIAYTKMPNQAVYEYDEYGNLTPNYFSPAKTIQGQYPGTYNPLALANEASATQYGERITPHFQLQYQILPGLLTSRFDIQFDINNSKSKTFLPQIASGRPATETNVNRASDIDGDAYNTSAVFSLGYTPTFKNEKHVFSSALSFRASDNSSFSYRATTSNTASSSLQDVADASRTQNDGLELSSSQGRNRNFNLSFQSSYSFLDRYVLNLTGTMDGNSNYGPKNRIRFFPSLAARWRVSEEPFMKRFTFLNDFSFKADYGLSGNGSGGSVFNTYVPTSFTYMGLSGIKPGNIGLDNLKPQIKAETNVGIILAMLQNRFKLDFNLYHNNITDLIFNGLQIPNYTGYSTITANVGRMTNNGLEIGLNTQPIKTKNWLVSFDLSVAKNVNIINEVSEYYPRTDGKKVNENGKYRTFLQIGNPFGSFYGFKYKGVYTDKDATIATDAGGQKVIGPNGQVVYMRFNYPATDYIFQPGDAKYEDINHDGNINEADIVYLGNGTPKLTGGFGPGITFKGNLKLSAFFTYRAGFQLINETLINTTNMTGYDNQSTVVLKRWRNPGDVTDVPRAFYKGGYNWLGSDRYVSDADFIRLKSITMRYTFTKPILSKLKVKNANVYVTAENLYTWTNYLGVNPDVSSSGPNTPFGYVSDKSRTPPAKTFTLGLNVGF